MNQDQDQDINLNLQLEDDDEEKKKQAQIRIPDLQNRVGVNIPLSHDQADTKKYYRPNNLEPYIDLNPKVDKGEEILTEKILRIPKLDIRDLTLKEVKKEILKQLKEQGFDVNGVKLEDITIGNWNGNPRTLGEALNEGIVEREASGNVKFTINKKLHLRRGGDLQFVKKQLEQPVILPLSSKALNKEIEQFKKDAAADPTTMELIELNNDINEYHENLRKMNNCQKGSGEYNAAKATLDQIKMKHMDLCGMFEAIFPKYKSFYEKMLNKRDKLIENIKNDDNISDQNKKKILDYQRNFENDQLLKLMMGYKRNQGIMDEKIVQLYMNFLGIEQKLEKCKQGEKINLDAIPANFTKEYLYSFTKRLTNLSSLKKCESVQNKNRAHNNEMTANKQ